MAVRIRMSRGGVKKRPFYRIVVADGRMPRDGRFIERLGSYDPSLPADGDGRVVLNEERAEYWLARGARPSDRVARFLADAGLWTRTARHNPLKGRPGQKAQERLRAAEEVAAAAAAAAATRDESAPTADSPS